MWWVVSWSTWCSSPSRDGRLPGIGRKRRQVLDRQRERPRRVELEAQAALAVEVADAQHLVAGDQGFERPLERRQIEPAAQLDRQRDVVGRRLGLELVEEEKPPLAEGGGWQVASRKPWLIAPLFARRGAGERRRETGDGRPAEEDPQRDLHSEAVAQPGEQLRGEQGVAAADEEIRLHARFGEAEKLAPQLVHRLLEGVARGDRRFFHGRRFEPAGLEQLAVDLEIGVERQLFLRHVEGGQREGGDGAGQELTQAFGARRRHAGFGRLVVGGQLPFAAAVGHQHHRAGADRRMAAERAFDLAELDAETAQLDLVVDPAEVVELAARLEAHQIARAVQPGSRPVGEGMRHEGTGGERRPPVVGVGQRRTAEP
jgi:hypothetical protein